MRAILGLGQYIYFIYLGQIYALINTHMITYMNRWKIVGVMHFPACQMTELELQQLNHSFWVISSERDAKILNLAS